MRFGFVQNNSATIEAQLERGELDLIFVAVPPGHGGFGWTRVVDQQLVLIVPRGHRLARRRQVRLRDVADERFVSFKQGHAIRRMTDDLCKAAGFVPEISFEADDSSSVPGFVAAGFGVAHRPAGGVRLCRRGEPQDHRAGGAAPHRHRLGGRPLPVGQRAAVS